MGRTRSNVVSNIFVLTWIYLLITRGLPIAGFNFSKVLFFWLITTTKPMIQDNWEGRTSPDADFPVLFLSQYGPGIKAGRQATKEARSRLPTHGVPEDVVQW